MFPLRSLSNLAIYSRENDDSLFPYNFCVDGTSHILKYLANSQKLQDLHFVTVYLDNLKLLLTKEIMSLHKMKVKNLLNDIDPKASHREIFTVCKIKSIFKCLNPKKILNMNFCCSSVSFQLLNFYRNNMSFKNTRIIRNLLLLMKNEVSQLSNEDLRNTAWVCIDTTIRFVSVLYFIFKPIPLGFTLDMQSDKRTSHISCRYFSNGSIKGR